jgi:transposase
MAKRSRVELFEQIRKSRERGEASIAELARSFKVHRRTVRAALSSPVPPDRKKLPPRPSRLDPWKPLIREWLEADRSAPRKQRHTARRVWERLRDEHGVTIGESTVRRYVAEVRASQPVALAQVMIPQRHVLGDEGEVDFGTISVYLAGVLTEVQLFVMRLSACGKGFPRAYENECQEVFLDGHVRAFEHFGGVPARIRYDNLKAAVVRVARGRDRVESDRFVALRSHYGFDSFFCQPGIGGAHEKGGVEGEIGRFRRRHLVPVPHVGSIAELNERLLAAAALDDGRHIAARHLTVAEHFALEAAALRPLPAERFDYTSVGSHRVDRKSRVSVRGCTYSVPVRYVGRRLDVRVSAETIEALDGDRVVAAHVRGRKGDEILTLDHYLEVLAIKPGALAGATALARARAAGAFTEIHDQFWAAARRRLGDSGGTRALIEVLLLHRTLPAPTVIAGIERALVAGSVDAEVVAIEARRASEHVVAPVVAIGTALARFERPPPTVAHYDQLLEAQ